MKAPRRDPPETPTVEGQRGTAADGLRAAREAFAGRIQHLRDREMMAHPERWPRRPFLCLTHRRERDPESQIFRLALMCEGYPTCVFPVNLYDVPAFGGTMTKEQFFATKIEYASVEALLVDWQVD